MDFTKKGFENIEAYIATFPADVQKILQEMRKVIKEAAPQAVEKISYQMPTFYLEGNLVHFAAFKNHIGFYPAQAVSKPSRTILPNTKVRKAPSDFRKISRCHMI